MNEAICIIPARGGSTRIPRKNLKLFAGKPILSYSIAVANQVCDRVIVSTEDMEIADVAAGLGAEVHQRKFWFARDEVGTQDVVRHVLCDYDFHMAKVVVLYPCAPLLVKDDIVHALALCTNNYVVAVGTAPLRDAGAMYVGPAYMFRESAPLYDTQTRLLPLPEARVCDINYDLDFLEAEQKWHALNKA